MFVFYPHSSTRPMAVEDLTSPEDEPEEIESKWNQVDDASHGDFARLHSRSHPGLVLFCR